MSRSQRRKRQDNGGTDLRQCIPPIFHLPKSKSAPDWECEGHNFEPQLHFTGSICDEKEAAFVERLISEYASHIVAHYYSGGQLGPAFFSIELQFGDTSDDRQARLECRKQYHTGPRKPVDISILNDKSKAYLIGWNGNIKVVSPKDGKKFDLGELQAHVGGANGWTYMADDRFLIVNDNGLSAGLPFNRIATRVWGLWPQQYIVGDVLLCRKAHVR